MLSQLKLDDTAKVLESLKADIIALQEVDDQTLRSEKVNQAEFLGKSLGMHHVFGKAMNLEGGGYGQAILSKYPILKSKVHQLPGDGEPRIALEVTVEPEIGKKISFVSVHLSYGCKINRELQTEYLLNTLNCITNPIILLGDFNDNPDSDSMKLFNEEWYYVPKIGNTFTMHADEPEIEIDHFLIHGMETEGISCQVIDEKVVSDHSPIRMKL